jgi:hypothetical protein
MKVNEETLRKLALPVGVAAAGAAVSVAVTKGRKRLRRRPSRPADLDALSSQVDSVLAQLSNDEGRSEASSDSRIPSSELRARQRERAERRKRRRQKTES